MIDHINDNDNNDIVFRNLNLESKEIIVIIRSWTKRSETVIKLTLMKHTKFYIDKHNTEETTVNKNSK